MSTEMLELEEARLGALNIPEALTSMLLQAPQTQQDVSQLAQTSQWVQSPEFQKQAQQIKSEAETYLGAQLAFQMVGTIATFGIFLIALHAFVKGKKLS